MLSENQKNKFLETSGMEWDGFLLDGEFKTMYPYNDKEWNMSPWTFRFKFDTESHCLFCEMSHKMTNNHLLGWDCDGNELPLEIIEKIFANTDPFIEFFKKKMNK